MNTDVSIFTMFFQKNYTSIISLIQSHPNELKSTNKLGMLPLHYACSLCSSHHIPMNVIKLLIEFFPESAKTPARGSLRLPIHIAVKCGLNSSINHDICKMLLDYYPNGAKFQDVDGHTALSYHLWSSTEINFDIVEMLLDCHKDSVRMFDKYRCYPLHYAGRHDNEDLLIRLIELFPEALTMMNISGNVPEDDCHQNMKRILQQEKENKNNLVKDCIKCRILL